jgi:hypothetical protein
MEETNILVLIAVGIFFLLVSLAIPGAFFTCLGTTFMCKLNTYATDLDVNSLPPGTVSDIVASPVDNSYCSACKTVIGIFPYVLASMFVIAAASAWLGLKTKISKEKKIIALLIAIFMALGFLLSFGLYLFSMGFNP